MHTKGAAPIVDREVSWLAFNARVLQEAADPAVPLGARLDFLAIFSSNLDEFFRVRVASLRSLLRLSRKSTQRLDVQPKRQLARIHRIVDAQQVRFGEIFRDRVLPALGAHGIHLVDDTGVSRTQAAWLRQELERMRPYIEPIVLDGEAPFLENRGLYLIVELLAGAGPSIAPEPMRYGLLRIPDELPRFLTLPPVDDRRCVIFLDDVLRLHMATLFEGWRTGPAFAVKLTRDAELNLEDEYSVDLVEAIRRSVKRRALGVPSRFLYDQQAPHGMVLYLRNRFELEEEDLVPGGRYHNLNDLAEFPRFGIPGLSPPPVAPLVHPLCDVASVLDAVAARDHLLHLPYQTFEPVTRFVEEAAADPGVEEIWITLYRVPRESAVVNALVDAAAHGKRVTAFVEVKARFDEETNLEHGGRLEAAGVRTLYSLPGLKVHCKLILVVRRNDGAEQRLACLSTGNFNERTARVYADHALFTADPRMTEDVRRVFAYLTGEEKQPRFTQLLVAPFGLRRAFNRHIDRETEAVKAGQPAGMILKMNSLEDVKMVRRLYRASRAGVPIRLIVRGICRLAPGVEGHSETIEARSIVDRYLEHARIHLFQAGGREVLYLASADWMSRNLNRRVEVAFPVHDPELRRELRALLDLQLADNRKARILDRRQTNAYASAAGPPVRAQVDFQRYLERRVRPAARSTPLVTSPAEGHR